MIIARIASPCLTVMATGCRRMSSVAAIGQIRRCEPVQGANNGGDERVSTAVAGIVEDVKLTGATRYPAGC
jgi:hypothetical protein